jgi:hypothetical protein
MILNAIFLFFFERSMQDEKENEVNVVSRGDGSYRRGKHEPGQCRYADS